MDSDLLGAFNVAHQEALRAKHRMVSEANARALGRSVANSSVHIEPLQVCIHYVCIYDPYIYIYMYISLFNTKGMLCAFVYIVVYVFIYLLFYLFTYSFIDRVLCCAYLLVY